MLKKIFVFLISILFFTINVYALNNIYLNNLSIDGYDINFNKNTFNYTIDVGYEVNNLMVNAYSDQDYEIVGTGLVHINEGENTIVVKVKDKSGNSSNYIIKVNRVVKVSNIVNNNIEDMIEAFKSNKELIVNLNNDSNKVVTKDMLDLIKGKKRTITYNILDNNDIIYSYIFNGSKFNNSYNDINLSISFNEVNDDILNKINDKKSIYFSTDYKEYYPMGTLLKIKNINEYNNASFLRLYNVKDNNLELIKNNIKINNRLIEFDITNGGDYLLSIKNTKSRKIDIILIISSSVILIGLLILGYLLLRRRKQIKVPELNDYLEK